MRENESKERGRDSERKGAEDDVENLKLQREREKEHCTVENTRSEVITLPVDCISPPLFFTYQIYY